MRRAFSHVPTDITVPVAPPRCQREIFTITFPVSAIKPLNKTEGKTTFKSDLMIN
jgi:hypothetical protein